MALTLEFLATIVAIAISPRREPWDTNHQISFSPGRAGSDLRYVFLREAAVAPAEAEVSIDLYSHGLRHGLIAATPIGVKVSAVWR